MKSCCCCCRCCDPLDFATSIAFKVKNLSIGRSKKKTKSRADSRALQLPFFFGLRLDSRTPQHGNEKVKRRRQNETKQNEMKKKNANKVDEKTNRDHRDGRRRQMSPSMTTEATPGVGFSLPPTPPRPSLFLKTAPTNQCRRRPASAIKMAFSSLPSLRDGSRVIDRQKKNTKKKRRRRPRPDIIGK